ncbi:MAG: Lrp/AsnC family transcriptional regulator [Gemmatimonadales bacterium]|jgi:Lrp/AsnC family leucine-responsive transcriptional regulator|nr:Lrp/AsnC family transcriptional regulator [Gemmatimonadales bacterium]
MVDSIDRRLLALLQADARTGYQELGAAVGLSGPAAYQRVRKLEEAGVLTGYHAAVHPAAIGRHVVAFLRAVPPATATDLRRLEETWRAMPDVVECHLLTGPVGYLLKLRLREIRELEGHLEALRRAGCTVTAEIAVSTAFERSSLPVA